ncbi:protein tyrosine phosphatase domain-containing protein 1-like isoform X2 [Bolinopsis microptera]|uniref:protein tyrosine phosphatase domain-containing protein 1-like isoform X2 n=1 Tax=Bolinopsis microptera TaxID=2820187 RepID=UPI003079A6F7
MQVVSQTPTTTHHNPKSVNASYSRLSEAFRHVTAGPLQCQVFCGGKSCKYERSDVWSAEQMAIPGLFSHWVTDNILAMARPNYTEMKKHSMIDSFKKSGITAIINLQETGEHASCGNSLHSSGFSYDPIEFMDNEIYYYNFNIQDYSVPLQRFLLDICKVVTFAQSEGCVAIHCHAGLGRTGVVIACFLVYHHKMKPKDAILLVRKNRPRSIQTRGQLKAVFRFANFLSPLWIQFPSHAPLLPSYNLEEIIANQKIVLHGTEGKTLKYTPKVVYMVCCWVMEKVGQPTSVLHKRIRANNEVSRPVTCPSSYQQYDLDEDDLDSLNGAECTEKEVEELERLMSTTGVFRRSRSVENVPDLPSPSHPYDIRINKISHRLNLSPRSSRTQTHINQDQANSSDTVVSSDSVEAPENDLLQEGDSASILDLHNISEDADTAIKQFLAGVSGKELQDGEGSGAKYDIDLVISQINVGVWESTSDLAPFQLGSLLKAWFNSLSKPVLSVFEMEALLRKCDIRVRNEGETTPKYLERLANAFDTLSPPLVATVHCLATAFAVLLYGPFHLKSGEVFSILQHLLTQKDTKGSQDTVELKRLSPILTALLHSKRNEILRVMKPSK